MLEPVVLPVSTSSSVNETKWQSTLCKPSASETVSSITYTHSTAAVKRNLEQSWPSKFKKAGRLVVHHLKVHAGMGLMCSVAYFDPGNWGVDLQAGAEFGYKLLFVVLFASIMAVIFQVMAAKLGCVTGLDLATHCRLLLHSRKRHAKFFHYWCLWPLYVLCEVAIIATELAELIGSATALSLLFPSLPLWAGVLITSADVLVVLAMGDTSGNGGPSRCLELIVGCLVITVFGSLIAVVGKVSPPPGPVFDGFLPSKAIFENGGLYTSVAIIGATVMPHGLFLGSALSTQGRALQSDLKFDPQIADSDGTSPHQVAGSGVRGFLYARFWHPIRYIFRVDRRTRGPDTKQGHEAWPNNSLAFVRAHFWHGIVDVVGSLLGFAVVINATILIVASAVFFDVPGVDPSSVGLFQAFDVISANIGKVMAILFAVSLLCAGQSASITATMAGQIVTEGFWQWRISPVLRRLLARLLGLIPSLIIAVVIGPGGVNALLVASQVVLSVVLPFVAGPLVYFTSSKKIMRVKNPNYHPLDAGKEAPQHQDDLGTQSTEPSTTTAEEPEYIDYSNSWIVTIIGWVFWFMMVVANLYVIVELCLGND